MRVKVKKNMWDALLISMCLPKVCINEINYINRFFPPASAVEGIKSVPHVCLSVCPSVCQHSHGCTI